MTVKMKVWEYMTKTKSKVIKKGKIKEPIIIDTTQFWPDYPILF